MLLPLLLLFELWATPTFAQWANEPSGATRVLNCPMSAADCVGGVVRGTWLDIYPVSYTHLTLPTTPYV